MAEERKSSDESTSRGQDWEVVSLTASTYAACPGPKKPDESGSKNEEEDENYVKFSEDKSPAAMVQSQHFIFPPRHHEDLPIEKEVGEAAECLDISHNANVGSSLETENPKAGELVGEIDCRVKDLKRGGATDENIEETAEISYNIKMGSSFEALHQSTESLHSTELFVENEIQIPLLHGKDVQVLKGLDWSEPRQRTAVDDDKIGAHAAKLNIFHDDVGGVSSSSSFDESKVLANLQKGVQEQNFGLPKPFSDNTQQDNEISLNSLKDSEAKTNNGKDQSYEAWLKRQAASLRDQVRQSNTLWPIAIAVALTGIVILGHRWQHEKWQNQQLRLELGEKEEKVSQMMYQLVRLKEAFTGHQKVPIIRYGST